MTGTLHAQTNSPWASNYDECSSFDDLKQLSLFETDPLSSSEEFSRDLEVLRHSHVFAGLSKDELIYERKAMDACHFRAGQLIMCDDQTEQRFHTILHGRVEFIASDGHGGELVIGEAGPGGFFGELAVLLDTPSGIKIRAKDDVSTLALEPGEFKDFVASHPSVAFDVLRDTAPRLARIDRLLRESISRNPTVEAERNLTAGQRIADRFAETMGSWRFILTQAALLGGWIA